MPQAVHGKDAVDNYSSSDIEHLIDEWVHKEKYRKILKRRLIDGICYEPLAAEFDMSVRQIKNIVYKESDKVLGTLNHKSNPSENQSLQGDWFFYVPKLHDNCTLSSFQEQPSVVTIKAEGFICLMFFTIRILTT